MPALQVLHSLLADTALGALEHTRIVNLVGEPDYIPELLRIEVRERHIPDTPQTDPLVEELVGSSAPVEELRSQMGSLLDT